VRARNALAALNFHELFEHLPATTIEALLHGLLLCFEAQAALALLIGADAVVGDEFPVVRSHGKSVFVRSKRPYAYDTSRISEKLRNAVRDRPRYKRNSRHEEKLEFGKDIPRPQEVSAILHHAPDRWRPLLVVAAFTGLRASELRGLRWEDVDLKRGVLTVSQRADRYGVIGSPKSKTSRRKVPFGPIVASALRPGYIAAGGKGIAFPTSAGTIVEHSNLVKASIIKAAEAAGVPQYTGLHCLRHFYASWCLNRKEDGGLGYSFQQVKELMGHSSITITVDRYGHLFENGDPNTLEAAEQALMALHAQ
jgi:integrase